MTKKRWIVYNNKLVVITGNVPIGEIIDALHHEGYAAENCNDLAIISDSLLYYDKQFDKQIDIAINADNVTIIDENPNLFEVDGFIRDFKRCRPNQFTDAGLTLIHKYIMDLDMSNEDKSELLDDPINISGIFSEYNSCFEASGDYDLYLSDNPTEEEIIEQFQEEGKNCLYSEGSFVLEDIESRTYWG